MFEKRHEPLLAPSEFAARMLRAGGVVACVVAGALLIGTTGYHGICHLGWVDSFLNASMILGGMGQVDTLHTDAGKIFASFYALFSGIVFLAMIGLVFAPVMHRVLHHFHLESQDDEDVRP